MKFTQDGSRAVRYFYQMSEAEKERNSTKYETVEVSIRYSLGGMNYFSGNRIARGYKLYVSPCTVRDGFRQSTIMGVDWDSGFAIGIMNANRFNKRELMELAEAIDPDEVARIYCSTENERASYFNSLIGKFNKTPICQ